MKQPASILCTLVTLVTAVVAGQQKALDPGSLRVFNRSVSDLNDGARKAVRLTEGAGEGVAYVQGVELANGTIELDVRGKDVLHRASWAWHFTASIAPRTTRSIFVPSTSEP